jgi:hypothetical protein
MIVGYSSLFAIPTDAAVAFARFQAARVVGLFDSAMSISSPRL